MSKAQDFSFGGPKVLRTFFSPHTNTAYRIRIVVLLSSRGKGLTKVHVTGPNKHLDSTTTTTRERERERETSYNYIREIVYSFLDCFILASGCEKMPTLPPIVPDRTTAGITVDPKTLERVVPQTKRSDGRYAM